MGEDVFLAKIDEREAQAWVDWQQSRDPHFLDTISECVQERFDLLGVDAPK